MNEAFAKALTVPAPDVPEDVINTGNRFNVYRNNYLVGLIDVLADIFPVTNQLVGREYFDALAHTFAAEQPPTSPILDFYGDGFAGFLETFARSDSPPYLPCVARVEWARAVALTMSHQSAFLISSQAELERALEMPVQLAPGASLIRSHYPVGTIWQRHQEDEVVPITYWVPEMVAVWWGSGQVQQEVIQPDVEAMMSALAAGTPFLDTLDNTAGEKQATHLLGTFTTFLNQGLLVPGAPENAAENAARKCSPKMQPEHGDRRK